MCKEDAVDTVSQISYNKVNNFIHEDNALSLVFFSLFLPSSKDAV